MLRWGSLVVDKSFESLCFNLEPHSTLSLSAFTVLFRFQTNQPVLLQLPSPTLPLPNQTHISIFNQKELKAEDVTVSVTKERKKRGVNQYLFLVCLFVCPTQLPTHKVVQIQTCSSFFSSTPAIHHNHKPTHFSPESPYHLLAT